VKGYEESFGISSGLFLLFFNFPHSKIKISNLFDYFVDMC